MSMTSGWSLEVSAAVWDEAELGKVGASVWISNSSSIGQRAQLHPVLK
jgi:hypothetical protein